MQIFLDKFEPMINFIGNKKVKIPILYPGVLDVRGREVKRRLKMNVKVGRQRGAAETRPAAAARDF